ncbi:MAG: MBL fold metallo-hydrolase [Candidatus Omnitrophota bacterium]
MIENIHWLGHAAFMITGKAVIYIDPYKIKEGSRKADVLLITHGHADHFSQEDIKKIVKPETIFVAPHLVAPSIDGQVRTVHPGDKINIGDIGIEAVPSYNIGKRFHPPAAKNVGYIVTVLGLRIYHAGDTDVIPEMKNIQTDIALLPCGGTYTMNAQEAAQAAALIKPQIVIPMHGGTGTGSRADADNVKKFCTGCEVVILRAE